MSRKTAKISRHQLTTKRPPSGGRFTWLTYIRKGQLWLRAHFLSTKQFALYLIILGLFLMGLSLTHAYLRNRSLRLTAMETQAFLQTQMTENKPKPKHIFIRWFVDVAIEDQAVVNGVWGVAENAASYLTQSARPGDSGNIIVYGHNTRKNMGNIRALKGGEIVYLTLDNGQVRKYRVRNRYEIPPTQIQYLQPMAEEVLTLYTCSGFMDKNRFIVQAYPYQEAQK